MVYREAKGQNLDRWQPKPFQLWTIGQRICWPNIKFQDQTGSQKLGFKGHQIFNSNVLIAEQKTFSADLTNLIWSQIDQTLMANSLGRYFGFGQTNLFWEASIRF
jgi:hypothetical protein